VTAHRLVNPETLPPAVGFSHAVVAAPGRTVYLGGQIGEGDTVAEQYERAAANVVEALRAADAQPEHLVSLTIFVTDVRAYRATLKELAAAHLAHFGRHYPATALFEVKGLFDPAAKVELVGIAVVPD
jgi:enamine deaminase RidA (YjgF/YER057c/UK114 family)